MLKRLWFLLAGIWALCCLIPDADRITGKLLGEAFNAASSDSAATQCTLRRHETGLPVKTFKDESFEAASWPSRAL